MSDPKYCCEVSVVVPIFNAEKTLVRCLDSLVNQTFDCFEVLLVDDGSTDSSNEICERYCCKDSRFKLFKQKNKGPASARNNGIDRASGRFLYFVDADDLIHPESLSTLYNVADFSGAEVVICGLIQIKDGIARRRDFSYTPGLYENDLCRKVALDVLDPKSDSYIPPFSGIRLIRREVLEKPRLRFCEEIYRTEDYLFANELHFRIRKVSMVTNHALYCYVENPESITNSYLAGYWGMVKRIHRILQEILPRNKNVCIALASMLISRSSMALNVVCRTDRWNTFSKEIVEILNDNSLRNAIQSFSYSAGLRRFRFYFFLHRFKLTWIIKIRYSAKYFLNNFKI